MFKDDKLNSLLALDWLEKTYSSQPKKLHPYIKSLVLNVVKEELEVTKRQYGRISFIVGKN